MNATLSHNGSPSPKYLLFFKSDSIRSYAGCFICTRPRIKETTLLFFMQTPSSSADKLHKYNSRWFSRQPARNSQAHFP